tara:strand:+ start:269 stop:1024 length:756 start_codon:yes stop_codon:yes gene_type:complete
MPYIIFQDLFAGINHLNSNSEYISLFSSAKYAVPMGLSAGIIHVVTGADHLVAMAPSSITNPKSALKNGLSWGLGHTSGIIILSILAIFIRDIIPLERFSSFAELLVGISLLIIGVIAIKNSRTFGIHSHQHKHNNGISHKHYHYHQNKTLHNKNAHALTGLGLLHGIAGGSHLVPLIFVITIPDMQGAILYLFAYLIGSFVIMSMFTYLISISTLKFGKNQLKSLIAFAGGISFSVGLFWIQKSTFIVLS